MLYKIVTACTLSVISAQAISCDAVKSLYDSVSLNSGIVGCCEASPEDTFDVNSCVAAKSVVDALSDSVDALSTNPVFETVQVEKNLRLGSAQTDGSLSIKPPSALRVYPKFYSKFVTFGDSNVDNGLQTTTVLSIASVLNYTYTRLTNYQNTAYDSNYKTFYQIAAEKMRIPLESYAVSAGWSGTGEMPHYCSAYNFLCGVTFTGLSNQVDHYMSQHNTTADSDALYGFMVGSNDIFRFWGTAEEILQRASDTITNVKARIEQLIAAGGRSFVVGNRAVRPDVTSFDDANGRYLNSLYVTMVSDLKASHPDLTFELLDVYSIGRRLQEHPSDYGIDSAKATAYVKDLIDSGNVTFQESLEYVRFDGAHMAFAAHQAVSEQLVSQLG